jgi:hypothetical protein
MDWLKRSPNSAVPAKYERPNALRGTPPVDAPGLYPCGVIENSL